jgi:hypothetical protein
VKRSSRPQSALRRPPKIKDGAKELQARDIAPAAKKAVGIIIDGQNDDVSVWQLFIDLPLTLTTGRRRWHPRRVSSGGRHQGGR